MQQVKTCMLDNIDQTPTLEDIKECVEIAKRDNCVVELRWQTKWSGAYARYIWADDDPQEYFNNKIPHVYGL